MKIAKVYREEHDICSECLEEIDKCHKCGGSFMPEDTIICVKIGHFHLKCFKKGSD